MKLCLLSLTNKWFNLENKLKNKCIFFIINTFQLNVTINKIMKYVKMQLATNNILYERNKVIRNSRYKNVISVFIYHIVIRYNTCLIEDY